MSPGLSPKKFTCGYFATAARELYIERFSTLLWKGIGKPVR